MRTRVRRKALRTLTSLCIVAILLGGVSRAKSQEPNRYVPDSAIRFGEVKQGEIVEHKFAVRNPGDSTLKLRAESLSQPGMKIRMPQELAAGSAGWITVSWDTQTVQGETTAEVLLLFNEADRVSLTLSGKIVPQIDILPYPAVFISGFRDESVKRTLEIVNNDAAPMNILGLAYENGGQSRGYSAAFLALEPGRKFQLHVEMRSTAPAGQSQGMIKVLTDSVRFPVIHIPVNMLLKNDVYINPESVDFGQVTGQVWSPELFLLKARRPVKVLSATSNLPFVKVTPAKSEASSRTHEFQAEIEGNPARGPFQGTIFIKTDDLSFPELKAAVEGYVE